MFKVTCCVILVVFAAIATSANIPYKALGTPVIMGPVLEKTWTVFTLSMSGLNLNQIPQTDRLYFGVTPFIGDADLFVSATKEPTELECSHCIINSTSPYDELVHIRRSSPLWPTTDTLYVGVYAFTQSEFTFNVWTEVTNGTLIDGYPQVSAVQPTRVQFFEFRPSVKQSVSISVTPRGGDMDIFVTTNPNKRPVDAASSYWSSTSSGADVIDILQYDYRAVGPEGRYYIGVKGYSMLSEFTIHATLEQNYVRLVGGIPIATLVPARGFKYFQFNVTQEYAGHSITFNNQQISGGAYSGGMYVTRTVSKASRPSPQNNEWSSFATSLTIKNAQEGTYYVAIYSTYRYTFQITVTTQYQSIELTGSEGIEAFVEAGEYLYFRYDHTRVKESFAFYAVPVVNNTIEMYESSTNIHPSEEKRDIKAENVDGYRVISHDMHKPQWYYLSVYGTVDANFTISVFTNYSYYHLKVGQPSVYRDLLAEQHQHFIYDVTDEDMLNNTMLTIMTYSYPGYVPIAASITNRYPTTWNSEWRSGDNQQSYYTYMYINTNETRFGYNNRRIYISALCIYSTNRNCRFYIQVNRRDVPIPSVPIEYTSLGTPVEVQGVGWTNFRVSTNLAGLPGFKLNEHVYFGLTPYTGNADLFVSPATYPTSKLCINCLISSDSPYDDAGFVSRNSYYYPGDSFYVSIFSTVPSTFSFNVWATKTVGVLEDGLPQVGYLDYNQMRYYEFTMPESSPVTFSVTPRSGDVNIYVSTTEKQPRDTWSSTWRGTDYGYDVVDVEFKDPNYRGAGTKYYVGIRGNSYNMRYTLYATLRSSYTRIVNGISLTDRATPGVPLAEHYKYFVFELTPQYAGQTLTFTLTSLQGDPNMFINLGNPANRPSPTNCQWCRSAYGSDYQIITNAQPGKYYIAITTTSTPRAAFQLTATTQEQSIELTANFPLYAAVLPNGYAYFRYRHKNPGNEIVSFAVQPVDIDSSVELYMSRYVLLPNENNHEDVGKQEGINGKVITRERDTNSYPFWYYISVKGNTAANFTLSAGTNATYTDLRNNTLLRYQYSYRDQYRYYTFNVDPEDLQNNTWVSFRLSSTNNVQYTMYASVELATPSADGYTWASTLGSLVLNISTFDNAVGDNTRFYLGVHMSAKSAGDTNYFSITAIKTLGPWQPKPTRPPTTTPAPTTAAPPTTTPAPTTATPTPTITAVPTPTSTVPDMCTAPGDTTKCSSHGDCINNACRCQKGYGGQFCEHFKCTDDCSKQGTCIAPFVCLCSGFAFGDHCENMGGSIDATQTSLKDSPDKSAGSQIVITGQGLSTSYTALACRFSLATQLTKRQYIVSSVGVNETAIACPVKGIQENDKSLMDLELSYTNFETVIFKGSFTYRAEPVEPKREEGNGAYVASVVFNVLLAIALVVVIAAGVGYAIFIRKRKNYVTLNEEKEVNPFGSPTTQNPAYEHL